MTTSTGTAWGEARAPLGDADVAALRTAFRGELLESGHDGYETARRVWNGNIDRRPALIARCADAADVQRAVDFARTRGLLLSVRGGGHSAPGYGTNDGGLVIDLSPMKGDPGGSAGPHRPGAGRRALARARLGNPGVRARHHRRHRLQHGDRRAHAGRRARLADGQARAHHRQPALRRRGHRRRPASSGQCDAAPRSLLGAAGRRRQLRRRDVVRVPAPSGGGGPGRTRALPAGSGARRPALLSRLLSDPARRGGVLHAGF